MSYIKDHYYHIYNRGCNRETIFYKRENYLFLLSKIQKMVDSHGVNIIGYCLLPNHYHFLIQQKSDKPLSDWTRDLFNGYTQAINIQQNRSGTLFEGRAKHKNIQNDEYLYHLMCYIHGNPVSAGLVAAPQDWEFSNYNECTGKRNGKLFDRGFIIDHFGSTAGYEEFYIQYYQDLIKNNNFTVHFNGMQPYSTLTLVKVLSEKRK